MENNEFFKWQYPKHKKHKGFENLRAGYGGKPERRQENVKETSLENQSFIDKTSLKTSNAFCPLTKCRAQMKETQNAEGIQ